jgi:hypothetical protein
LRGVRVGWDDRVASRLFYQSANKVKFKINSMRLTLIKINPIKVVQYQHQKLNSNLTVAKVMSLHFIHASTMSRAITNVVPMRKRTIAFNIAKGWSLTRKAIQLEV